MAAPLLEVSDLEAGYGELQVLWQVSFAVDPGEIVAILGPNGAGKTTLLRTVSGLNSPLGGSIRWDGQDITGSTPETVAALGIAHVPEGRRIFPYLTVQENLQLGAFTPRARRGAQQRLKEVYELFPALWQKRRQAAGQLSGGQQQMLAIGRGLMANPRLLIMDEPSLGLAPRIVQELFQLLGALRNQGPALLLVEQSAYDSLRVADRAYVLESGRIVADGTAESLLRNDAPWTAYFGLAGDAQN